MAEQYKAPDGPPPSYPKQTHQDAGSHYGQGSQSPGPGFEQTQQNGDFRGYGSPPPQQYGQGTWGPAGYGQQVGGPPQGGYYPPQQQGPMYYGQQPYGQPQGNFGPNRGAGAAEGCCGALVAAMACCCCMDLLF